MAPSKCTDVCSLYFAAAGDPAAVWLLEAAPGGRYLLRAQVGAAHYLGSRGPSVWTRAICSACAAQCIRCSRLGLLHSAAASQHVHVLS